MNERIKELAEQAGAVKAKHITNVPSDLVLVGEEEIAKFAKLILRECIDWCNAYSTIDGTSEKIAESIKKEFGLE